MQSTVAVISLKQIIRNARITERAAEVPLVAVIKDDAYGHGAVQVAHALSGSVKAFAVSTVAEGAELKIAGVTDDVLVLTPPLSTEEALRASFYGLIISLTSRAVLNLCRKTVETYGVTLRAHVAVNTGMNRYGFRPERVSEALNAKGVSIEGVYSHLYLPSSAQDVREQVTRFGRAVGTVKQSYPQAYCHLAATGGVLAGVKYDAARVGIALYGYLPAGFSKKLDVKPAAKLYATVSHQGVKLGGGMGYARLDTAGGKVYTLRAGYGDGLFRAGRRCMDATVQKGNARVGERKLLLSSVTDYAHENGTTEYEVLVNILRKAEKQYEY